MGFRSKLMATVLKNVYKRYDGGVVTVSDFNLDIKDKEFIILLVLLAVSPQHFV